MMTFINEPNLYRLIVHSKLESAQRFESWVFEEVLPTIRRTGSYGHQKCIDCRIFEKIEEVNANVNSLRTEIKERLETELNCKISVTINEKPLNKGSFQPPYRKEVKQMNDNTERLKPLLIDYIREVTTQSKGKDQYIFPFCNSGTGHNGTGAFTYYPDSHTYKCFACGEYGDMYTNVYTVYVAYICIQRQLYVVTKKSSVLK